DDCIPGICTAAGDEVEDLLCVVTGYSRVGVGHDIEAIPGEPLVTPGIFPFAIHPLLDDGPGTVGSEDEGVVVQAVSVLN
ncbi:hypothetical protein Q6253_31375, partial [Klebsiella quasipneumoniae]